MSHVDQTNPYAVDLENAVISAPESERAAFIRRTYTHLTGAILALIALEWVVFNVVPDATMQKMVDTMIGGYGWLVVLFGFMAVSLGYFDTLMSCSASSTSSELSDDALRAAGIAPGLLRMSIGFTGSLEQRWQQLERALRRVALIQ